MAAATAATTTCIESRTGFSLSFLRLASACHLPQILAGASFGTPRFRWYCDPPGSRRAEARGRAGQRALPAIIWLDCRPNEFLHNSTARYTILGLLPTRQLSLNRIPYVTETRPTRNRRDLVCADAKPSHIARGPTRLRPAHFVEAGAGAPQPDVAIRPDRKSSQGPVPHSPEITSRRYLDTGRGDRHQGPDGRQKCPLPDHGAEGI